MNQSTQQQQWPRRNAAQPQRHGRMKEQPEPSPLEQHAGQAARQILHESGLDNTAANWKGLKEAYLLGYNEGLLD